MRARHVWITASLVAILIQSVWANPAVSVDPTMVDTRERWYFAIPGDDGGGDAPLIALADALSAAGATRLQAFLPDLIVCDLPPHVAARAIAAPHGAVVTRAADASLLEGLGLSMSPTAIERVHARGRAALAWPESMPEPATAPEGESMTSLRAITEAEMRRSAERAPSEDSRLIHQNSEILAGRILMHVVLPESDYPEWDSRYENWSEDDIAEIKLGLYYTFLNYQEYFPNAHIQVVYSYRLRVLIKAEPIRLSTAYHDYWVTLTMNALGYNGPQSEIRQTVHEFNEETRVKIGADWAFAMFLASARRAQDHVFAGARSLTFTNVGGPYFISSYPAGHLDGAWGMQLVTEHEIGHMFWGIEEDVTVVTDCDTRSGYLNLVNENKVTKWVFILGSWQRSGCQEGTIPVPCIMNEFDQFAINSGYATPCAFTAGMMGVSDDDEDGIPDAFDRPPRIEFDSADTETVLTLPEYLGVRVVAQAVPNDNPMQPPDLRRDYAARIKSIDVSVGGLDRYTLLPKNIASDGYEASFVVSLPPPLPGPLKATVQARNTYEAQSPPRVKTYLYVGLAYLGFQVEHPPEGVALRWMMLGDTFDARMTVLRRNPVTDEEVVVADGVRPSGPMSNGSTPFSVVDSSVVVGTHYEYRVHGTIDLPHRGGFLHKEVDSRPVRVQAAVPRTHAPPSPISNASPNPFRDRTWISVSIPHVEEFGSGDPQDDRFDEALATPINVTIYDVLGRRVTRLYNGDAIGSALTLSWDGTNDNGAPMPSGVYFARTAVGAIHDVRKVLLIR